MVVAYLVTSHTLPDQLVRLVRTIRTLSPDAPVLVHHDGRLVPAPARELAEIGGVQLIPPEPVVEWGRASRLDMLLRCWTHALRHAEFDWLSLISGQDYPVRPLEVVERELAGTAFDGFLEGQVVTPPSWQRDTVDEFARRYFYRWSPVPEPGRLGRRAVIAARPLLALRDLPSGTMLGVRRRRTPFTAAMPCRRGSDWPTLSRRCVELLDRAVRERPDLVAFFRRTLIPDEAFLPTVLHAEPLRLSGDVRRFTRWEPGSGSPAVLGTGDLDVLLASGTDFARKFDVRADAAVLDALDLTLGV